jgi:hypothetical protein
VAHASSGVSRMSSGVARRSGVAHMSSECCSVN